MRSILRAHRGLQHLNVDSTAVVAVTVGVRPATACIRSLSMFQWFFFCFTLEYVAVGTAVHFQL